MEAGPIVERGKVERRVLIEVRESRDERCVVCRRPIQPGQLYVPNPDRHLGCRP